jgi:hypothetical protein
MAEKNDLCVGGYFRRLTVATLIASNSTINDELEWILKETVMA